MLLLETGPTSGVWFDGPTTNGQGTGLTTNGQPEIWAAWIPAFSGKTVETAR